MDKSTAFELLGGTPQSVARNCRCTVQAVHKWPNTGPLARSTTDKVLAARVRLRAELLQAQGYTLDPLEARALS